MISSGFDGMSHWDGLGGKQSNSLMVIVWLQMSRSQICLIITCLRPGSILGVNPLVFSKQKRITMFTLLTRLLLIMLLTSS